MAGEGSTLLHKERVTKWEQMPNLDFATNCVFVDEAGFNMHTQRNFGCSLCGTPAKGVVPTARGISVTILGAISSAGIIDVLLRKPEAVSAAKKQKANGQEVRIIVQTFNAPSRIANYVAAQIAMAYLNNVSLHFGEKLQCAVNRLLDMKARKAALVRRMAGQSQREIRRACEAQIWGPAHLIKEVAFTRPFNPPRLNDAGQAILRGLGPILRAYPEGYQFADNSLFLDAAIHPENHFWAYFRLSQLFEHDRCQFECFPQRKDWRPANMAVTTNILRSELLSGVLGCFGETALASWGRVLDPTSKPFRGEHFDFEEVMHTDAVGISVITRATGDGGGDGGDGDGAAPRGRQRRGWRRHRGRCNQGPEFQYVTELLADELAEDLGKCVFIDPGRRDILFCAHEDSTAEKPQTYRYTRNQRSKETRMKRFACIREKVKPEAVRAAEARLSRFSSTTVNLRRYKQYLEARAAEWDLLSDFYSNTRTTGNLGGHTYPLHCRLHLSAHLNQQQADQRLARNLRSKFGENPVLEIGDWSAPMARHHEQIQGVSMRRMLRRQGFKVHLVPEFRTSSLCPACLTG
ncbi:hypothetical protein LPJ61_004508 [Coemansia biformis]|uniref:Transposase n=1 Tax=Coemansia biformis TaxID=1286918 RepID=A0A9W7Y4P5_9FUNG|nr:hypothetical protein LPJ61_004508 [Coemansia biformis]